MRKQLRADKRNLRKVPHKETHLQVKTVLTTRTRILQMMPAPPPPKDEGFGSDVQ